MGRQRGEGPLAVEELLFLKKGGVAVGLGLVAETSKAACSTSPVVLWYVSVLDAELVLIGLQRKGHQVKFYNKLHVWGEERRDLSPRAEDCLQKSEF